MQVFSPGQWEIFYYFFPSSLTHFSLLQKPNLSALGSHKACIHSFIPKVFTEHCLYHSTYSPNTYHAYFQCSNYLKSKEVFTLSVLPSLRISAILSKDSLVNYQSGGCEWLPCVNKNQDRKLALGSAVALCPFFSPVGLKDYWLSQLWTYVDDEPSLWNLISHFLFVTWKYRPIPALVPRWTHLGTVWQCHQVLTAW